MDTKKEYEEQQKLISSLFEHHENCVYITEDGKISGKLSDLRETTWRSSNINPDKRSGK
jgi:hypothetical protein